MQAIRSCMQKRLLFIHKVYPVKRQLMRVHPDPTDIGGQVKNSRGSFRVDSRAGLHRVMTDGIAASVAYVALASQ